MKSFCGSKSLIAILIGLFILAAAGCSAEKSKADPEKEEKDKKVSMIFSFKSPNMDPHTGFTPIRAGVTETLLKLDEDSKIEGWLAEKWETENNVHWTFTIRDEVKFQDGKNLMLRQ